MRRTGFTLIEVVVALGVSAVILGVAAASLDAVMGGERRSTHEADDVRRGHRLELVFADDVKHMRMLQGDEHLMLKSGLMAGMRADAVSFTRSGGMVAGWTSSDAEREPPYSARRVAYVCSAEGSGLTLFRVETRPQSTSGVGVPVLRGLHEFAVSTIGVEQDGEADEGGVPNEVRVRLVFGDGTATEFGCFPTVTGTAKGPR